MLESGGRQAFIMDSSQDSAKELPDKPKKGGEKRKTSSRCIVYGCDNTIYNGFFVHTLPGKMPLGEEQFDPLQMKWISFIARKRKFTPREAKTYYQIYVCSGHFRREDYDESHVMMFRMGLRTRSPYLKKDSVPSIDPAQQPFPPDWFLNSPSSVVSSASSSTSTSQGEGATTSTTSAGCSDPTSEAQLSLDDSTSSDVSPPSKRIRIRKDADHSAYIRRKSLQADSELKVDLIEDSGQDKPRKSVKRNTGARCITFGCANTSYDGFILHQMPGQMPVGQEEFDNVQKQWISFIGRKRKFDVRDAKNYTKIFVCSGHFRPEDYDDTQLQMYRRGLRTCSPSLKKVAVPSLDNAQQPFPPSWFLPVPSAHVTSTSTTPTTSTITFPESRCTTCARCTPIPALPSTSSAPKSLQCAINHPRPDRKPNRKRKEPACIQDKMPKKRRKLIEHRTVREKRRRRRAVLKERKTNSPARLPETDVQDSTEVQENAAHKSRLHAVHNNQSSLKSFSCGPASHVCGIHFPDGLPTDENPYPILHMGYDLPKEFSIVRAPPKRRSPRPKSEASTSAEVNVHVESSQEVGDEEQKEQKEELWGKLNNLQEELKEALAKQKELTARHDSQAQAKVIKEMQDKYERQLLLHDAHMKQLVKEQESSEQLEEASDDGRKTENSQDGGSQDDTPQETTSQESVPISKRKKRSRRRCGHCKPCRRQIDCGKCNFCLDMKKFGGPNKQKQKCRLKQCLREAKIHAPISLILNSQHHNLSDSSSSSEESEIEQEIGQEIEKMKKRLLMEQRKKEKQKAEINNEDLEQLKTTCSVEQFMVDGESWTVMSAASGAEEEEEDADDRSSLYLSSSSPSSSSSSSSTSAASSPSTSPVQSPKRQSPQPSSSGFAVLPERQAKVATLVSMIDRMGKGRDGHKEKPEETGDEPKDDENALAFCLCKSTDYSQFIISCDYCAKLYHGKCVGVEELAAKFIRKYACPPCRDKDPDLTVVYGEIPAHLETDIRLECDETDISDKQTETTLTSIHQESKKEKRKAITTNQGPKRKKMMRIRMEDCGVCTPCTKKEDCGQCIYCKDKTRFGGTNIKKQKCIYRKCLKRWRKKPLSIQPAKSADQEGTPMKQYVYNYQTISYDTSKIQNPEVRKYVSHELQYHHDYALHYIKTVCEQDGDGVEKTESTEKNTLPTEKKTEPTKKKTESTEKNTLLTEKKTEPTKKKTEPTEKKTEATKKKKRKKEKKQKRKMDWTVIKRTRKLKVKEKEKRTMTRNQKRCGECEPCRRTEDCQTCDFCKDKAKYGGKNKLRQKCRLRQCKRVGLFSDSWTDYKRPKQPKLNIMKDCGECVACRTVTNCGSCVFCLDKAEFGGQCMWRQKCIFKQCLLRRNRPDDECGSCIACKRTSDCKQCKPCRENRKYRRVRKEKCLLRICLKDYTKCRPPTESVIVLDEDADGIEDQALTSSTSRILEAFPAQIKKWKQDPNFEGVDWAMVRSSLEEIERHLASNDAKMVRLQKIIAKPKKLSISDANRRNKEESSKSVTRGPPVIRESKFGDYLEAQQSKSVMKLRIMYHGSSYEPKKVSRRDVCGCPLEADTLPDTDLYCPLLKTQCEKHYNWEKLRQAELDLERMVWLMKLDELLDLGKGTRSVTTSEASATAVS